MDDPNLIIEGQNQLSAEVPSQQMQGKPEELTPVESVPVDKELEEQEKEIQPEKTNLELESPKKSQQSNEGNSETAQ